jgi:hypothetical protein
LARPCALNAPIRVAVAVVVTEQVLAPIRRVDRDLQRLVDALVELVRERRHEAREAVEVLLDIARRHAAHEVETRRQRRIAVVAHGTVASRPGFAREGKNQLHLHTIGQNDSYFIQLK